MTAPTDAAGDEAEVLAKNLCEFARFGDHAAECAPEDHLAWHAARLLRHLSAENARKDGEIASLKASLAVCQQSLIEQAEARADSTMPLLTAEVLSEIRNSSEAQWAFAETRKDRVVAHGLSLLCDWQDRVRAALLAGGTE